ncbi:hypothetical protein [Burkholderia ubonensis]|uniref:hypothetical protein n=1 Tax=Burkholderia ubonensis TaxID=101571 RepID=UPI0009B4C562|nr:hypothetical protein [Burkholderia ubonensis]
MKKLLLALAAITVLAGAATAHASPVTGDQVRPYSAAGKAGSFDPYTDGARAVRDARDPFTDGARGVHDARDVYTEGTIGSADLYAGS